MCSCIVFPYFSMLFSIFFQTFSIHVCTFPMLFQVAFPSILGTSQGLPHPGAHRRRRQRRRRCGCWMGFSGVSGAFPQQRKLMGSAQNNSGVHWGYHRRSFFFFDFRGFLIPCFFFPGVFYDQTNDFDAVQHGFFDGFLWFSTVCLWLSTAFKHLSDSPAEEADWSWFSLWTDGLL